MTEILAYPLNTASFDKEFYDATDAQTYTCTRLTGVYSSETDLRVLATGVRNVVVTEGLAWLNYDRFRGIACANTVEKNGIVTFTIEPSVTLPRIDRIVVSYNFNDDKVEIILRKGMPLSQPTPPSIRRDGSYYEIALADIAVSVGSGNITQAHITDLRLNEALCGIMRDGVTGIPTQQLYDQFNSWYNNFKNTSENDFNDWFYAINANYTNWFNNFKNTNQTNFDNWFNAIKTELEDFDPAQILQELEELRTNVDANTSDIANIKANGQLWRITENNGNVLLLQSSNLNDAIKTGFYSYNSNYTNKPTETGGMLVVTQTSSEIFQNATLSDGSIWMRVRNQSSVWSSWVNNPFPKTLPVKNSPEWIDLPLVEGWSPGFDADLGYNYGLKVYKDPQNFVHLNGHLWSGYDVPPRTMTVGLPVGYRPIRQASTVGFSPYSANLIIALGNGVEYANYFGSELPRNTNIDFYLCYKAY